MGTDAGMAIYYSITTAGLRTVDKPVLLRQCWDISIHYSMMCPQCYDKNTPRLEGLFDDSIQE